MKLIELNQIDNGVTAVISINPELIAVIQDLDEGSLVTFAGGAAVTVTENTAMIQEIISIL
jgi:hypothetical protein